MVLEQQRANKETEAHLQTALEQDAQVVFNACKFMIIAAAVTGGLPLYAFMCSCRMLSKAAFFAIASIAASTILTAYAQQRCFACLLALAPPQPSKKPKPHPKLIAHDAMTKLTCVKLNTFPLYSKRCNNAIYSLIKQALQGLCHPDAFGGQAQVHTIPYSGPWPANALGSQRPFADQGFEYRNTATRCSNGRFIQHLNGVFKVGSVYNQQKQDTCTRFQDLVRLGTPKADKK